MCNSKVSMPSYLNVHARIAIQLLGFSKPVTTDKTVYPVGTWCLGNIILTSMHYISLALMQHCINIVYPAWCARWVLSKDWYLHWNTTCMRFFFIHLLLLPFGFHSPSGLSRQLKCYQPFNPSIVCKQASVSPHIILVRLKPRMVQNQVIHTTVTATQDMMEKRNLIGKKCK